MKSPPPSATLIEPGADSPVSGQVRVWDLPVRLFHWLLVLLLAVSWYTGKTGGVYEMTWHMWSGYALLGLLLFRIAWGVMGSSSARFSQFVYGPRAMASYANGLVRRRPSQYFGHTPLGGWMTVAMLISLLVQVGTGLFANDDILTEGPLMSWVNKSTSDWLTTIHYFNFNVLLTLAGVHVAAVLYYALALRENLVWPMFTGVKKLRAGQTPPEFRFVGLGAAVVVGGAAALAVYTLVG